MADNTPQLERENVMLTPEMARQLNNDENTQVMTYEYDTPEKLLSMSEVLQVLEETRRRYTDLRAQNRDWDDPKLRHHLATHNAEIGVFSRTHPTIFQKATDRDAPSVMFERLQQMIRIRAQQERGRMDEQETAHAVEAVLRQPLK